MQGVLGGTFDPVHHGHLRLGEEALVALGLESVRWVPSGKPGHRGAPAAGIQARLDMLRLALAGHPRFFIDDAEMRVAEATFTIHTLQRLRRDLGASRPLALIIGADQMRTLPTWRAWRQLFDHAHIAVATRPGHELSGLGAELDEELRKRRAEPSELALRPAGNIALFTIPLLDISATSIRQRTIAGLSARYLLPAQVLDYIESRRLYTAETTETSPR